MLGLPILSIAIFLPIVGALGILLMIKGNDEIARRNARNTAVFTTIATFIWSLLLCISFEPANAGFQYVEKYQWLAGYKIYYHLGIDGISLTMILLTTFLTPLCILASWSIKERVKEFMICFLLMEGLVIGVFAALDMVLFYLFFEAVLIPMFLIIGIWGGKNRVYAAFKFFLYTFAGSVLLLIATIYMYGVAGTSSIPVLMEVIPTLGLSVQCWLWLALFASFAVKVPMWPFHTWLPDAHVQAPTAGSVILAGVLLKMGAYGFLRFSLPMLPQASIVFADMVYILSIIAIIYTSLVALVQTDMKKLIAYSSVAHMGYVTLGIFCFNQQGIDGAIFQMISHGLVSGALFLCVGVVYERQHTRELSDFGGLTERMPRYALLFMVFTMASVGLPATSGFVGEFITFMAAYQVSPFLAAFAATGVVFGAAYMLWLYRKVMFGELNPSCKNIRDVNDREYISLTILAVLVILFGLQPNIIFSVTDAPVKQILFQMGKLNG